MINASSESLLVVDIGLILRVCFDRGIDIQKAF